MDRDTKIARVSAALDEYIHTHDIITDDSLGGGYIDTQAMAEAVLDALEPHYPEDFDGCGQCGAPVGQYCVEVPYRSPKALVEPHVFREPYRGGGNKSQTTHTIRYPYSMYDAILKGIIAD